MPGVASFNETHSLVFVWCQSILPNAKWWLLSITDDSDVPFGLVQGSGHRGGGAWYFGLVQHKGPIHPIPAASSCPMVLVSSPGYLVSTLQVVCPSLIYWALKSKSLWYDYNQKNTGYTFTRLLFCLLTQEYPFLPNSPEVQCHSPFILLPPAHAWYCIYVPITCGMQQDGLAPSFLVLCNCACASVKLFSVTYYGIAHSGV